MNHRAYLYDAAGEAQTDRQREVEGIVDNIMDDVDEIMKTLEGDEHEILREIVGKLIAAPSHKEGGIEAYGVLLRRARHFAEAQ